MIVRVLIADDHWSARADSGTGRLTEVEVMAEATTSQPRSARPCSAGPMSWSWTCICLT
jgi:hypothetical protein